MPHKNYDKVKLRFTASQNRGWTCIQNKKMHMVFIPLKQF